MTSKSLTFKAQLGIEATPDGTGAWLTLDDVKVPPDTRLELSAEAILRLALHAQQAGAKASRREPIEVRIVSTPDRVTQRRVKRDPRGAIVEVTDATTDA